jgi:2,3-bisphosphoglycerate-dependent phosphoglycerate mutase
MDFYSITLLRHGESVGNAEGYYQGQYDFPLTEAGRDQVQKLVARWQADGTQFDQIIASPLARAKETAEAVASALDVPIQYEPLWKERDNGVLGGLKHEVADEKYPQPDFFTPYDNIGETGEGNFELYLRAGQAIHKLLRMPPARYLIVSHGGTLNQALYVVLGIAHQANGQGTRFRFGNTSITRLRYDPENHIWLVLGLNDCTHLD